MDFRNISAWAIRNPVAPIVLFIALTLAGMIAFSRLDVNQNPDISFPAAQVVISQPGAAPTELETQVTQRVEAAIRGINGVDEMSSYVSEGNSRTFVQFHIGTPVDRAVNDVRDALARIRSDLPEGILEPQVERVDVDGGPIAYVSAEAVDMTLEELSWFVDDTVAKRLLTIPGMSAVRRGGGVSREIRVILDPVKLQAQGLTAAQVNAQLRQTNVNAAGGRAEIAGAEQSVRVLGNARNAYELGQSQIAVGDGRSIKLADIADVRDLYAEQRSVAMMNNRQVLSFALEKSKGASDLAVYDEAKAMLAKIEKENPKIKFTELYTSVEYTREQYTSAIHAMIEGAVLAVIVVFLFLRDWRATVIAALAIPLSAIPTFWFMDLMGFTLNTVSLLALSLVAGVLVDDAIVEIENIVRHMRMGKTAYQAAIDAADEIGLAVLATTMAIVAVFLPVGVMGGISGQFFKQFGLTVVVSVLLSLAVARLITPMIAAYFLKAHGEESHGEGWLMDAYMRALHWSITNRWKTMGIGALSFVAMIFTFMTLPFTNQPTINTDYSQVQIQMVPGATLEQTKAVAQHVTDILNEAPEVAAAFADVNVGSDTNVFITLKKDRKRTSVEFERALAPKLRDIPDARVSFRSQSGGLGRDITVMLAGSDPDKLNATANRLVAEMAHLPQLRAPRVDGDLQRPEITIKPRLDLAASMGVTTAALSQTIRIATQGDIDQNVAKFSLSDRQIPIRVALKEASRRDLSTIENLPVPTANGGSVPLKVVAEIGFGAGPSELRRFNQNRRIVISADLAPGAVTAENEINALPTMKNLPQGVERVSFGDTKMMAELVNNFIIAVIAGVFLVFAVLVLLYKRIMPPLVNMGSLLLAPLGGGLALHLTGNPISMPVLIGLLMLLGIVAKNSILLVDFALEEMYKGVPKFEAIMDAGHKRAQPIVMTTVAMVAGMLPVALAISGDGSWRAPMGIVVIGGLILSTLLTLVIVPAAFSLAIGFESRLAPKLSRWLTNNEPREEGRPAPQPAE
ncbi:MULTISPECIES: efflux RND transporter permease subunit [Sphingomonadales]|uniref:AcrB/AcrD/AcrF family protein n=2 Tax=Edaphosphingomonas TaxID=3423724 RepID=A0A2T4I8H9_9SPHN|nr:MULTISPECIES: efflux RND transporter permease subunit [Sphingomonas]AGH49819.1 hydrophobic/amphiphilic exporter-1 [Sphingomonas sp. MM-1]MDX3883921.1 efflux RND transporter permease subunit [Sphingomonas sp.]OHT18135.1 Multidrug resistance protein MdtC [Sphingomonas haloaromaticamans]PTD28058.1 AcrB/AcrD/AcrF family protein [Sphingomonas fennica]